MKTVTPERRLSQEGADRRAPGTDERPRCEPLANVGRGAAFTMITTRSGGGGEKLARPVESSGTQRRYIGWTGCRLIRRHIDRLTVG